MRGNTPRQSQLPTHDRSSDRGIAVVFFAISVTAMLAVGALVLGGSIGYTAVRNAQTAADSAALAGASTLREHQQDWVETPAGQVFETVRSVVESNGSSLAAGGCELITADRTSPLGSGVPVRCDELDGLEEDVFQQVAGVRVTVADTRDVPFAAFVDQDTITGGAVAAATIQPVVETELHAPFLLCTGPVTGEVSPLVTSADDPTGYAINGTAIGRPYVLWGNQIKYKGRNCGATSSDWRGLAEFGSTFTVPSPPDKAQWWRTESGNKRDEVLTVPRNLASSGACDLDGQGIEGIARNCEIAVPLCPESDQSPSDFKLSCAKIGLFEISHIGKDDISAETVGDIETPCGNTNSNIICGWFRGGATMLNGRGAAGTAGVNDSVVVRLVE